MLRYFLCLRVNLECLAILIIIISYMECLNYITPMNMIFQVETI